MAPTLEMERPIDPSPEHIKQVRLHPRHRLFVEHYLKTGNATQAALKSGYSDGYKSGYYLLTLDKIKAAIQSRIQRLGVNQDAVLQEIAKLAFSNMKDFLTVDENGLPQLDFNGSTREQWAAISEYTEDATGGDGDGERRRVLRRKIKLQSKTHALEMLAKHLHLLDQKVEIDIGDALAERLNRARTRTLDATPDAAQRVIDAASVPSLPSFYDDSFDSIECSSNSLVNYTPTVRDDSFDTAIPFNDPSLQESKRLPPMGVGEGAAQCMENCIVEQSEDAGIIHGNEKDS